MTWRGIFFALLFFISLAPKALSAQYSEEDWKSRDNWMNIPALMSLLNIAEGDSVADVGCHEGYFSFHLSKRVGSAGKVYAVDVSEKRIVDLKKNIVERKVDNIIAILGDYDDPKLPENTMDAAIIMDTYHEMKDHKSILVHVKKALKPDGRLLILEKLKEEERDKSREDQVAAHTLSSKYVREELEEAGFRIHESIENFGDWKNDIQKQMWILVATPESM